MNEDPKWKLERPGAAAEEMFKDDPFMLASVRRKPSWWIALMRLTGGARRGHTPAQG